MKVASFVLIFGVEHLIHFVKFGRSFYGFETDQNKLKRFQHSMILLDREFDVDENYWAGINNNIELHIRQKDTGRIRLPGRKKGKQAFDWKKYGKRKLGERPFGNIEKRRVKCYYRSEESRLKGCLIIGIEYNIIEWYKSKVWCGLFVELKN